MACTRLHANILAKLALHEAPRLSQKPTTFSAH